MRGRRTPSASQELGGAEHRESDYHPRVMGSAPRDSQTSELVLGTAQFGLRYGITNHVGQVRSEEVRAIVDAAVANGIRWVDTARGYGTSESALAQSLAAHSDVRVITKVPALASFGHLGVALTERIIESTRESSRQLGRDPVDMVLCHSASDLSGAEGAELASAMWRLQDEGLVRGIGFSAYSVAEAASASKVMHPDVVQLPMSVFDQRILEPQARQGLDQLRASGTKIHVRSIFLQGLAVTPTSELPDAFSDLSSKHSRFERACKDEGVTQLEACVAFARDCEMIDGVVVGVTSSRELEQICRAFRSPPIGLDWESFAANDSQHVDPRTWRN